MKIVNKKVIRWVREQRDGVCLWGMFAKDSCFGPLDVHHILPRSLVRYDDPTNLITLCRKHHNMAERKDILASQLMKLLTEFHGYDYTEFIEKFGEFKALR